LTDTRWPQPDRRQNTNEIVTDFGFSGAKLVVLDY